MALPPQHYDEPKGAFWKGTHQMERFTPTYKAANDVFEEYLGNKSLAANKHSAALATSSGLLELHYDTMRKKQKMRSEAPCFVKGPTMGRSFSACPGYSGFIPGKESTNIVGCTHTHGSRIANETRGKFYDPPMSGVTYHIRGANPSRAPLGQSASLTSLGASLGASSPTGDRPGLSSSLQDRMMEQM